MRARQRVQVPAAAGTDWADTVERADTEDVRVLLRARRRRRVGRWLSGALVVLAVAAVVTLLVRSSLFAPAVDDASGGVPVADDQGVLLDTTDPFDGTPAARWPDGAAGIVPPAPEAVGGFDAEQVARTTQLVRDVLVASRLDPRLLVRHDPADFLDKLAPDARRQLQPLFGTGREPEVQSLVSLVAPGSTLLPVEAKVSGSMSVAAGEAGELVVHTNYVFAYAFQPPGPMRLVDVMNVVVVVRADVDYVWRAGDRWAPGSRGLWYDDASGFGYSIACSAYRHGFLAPAAAERAAAPRPEDGEPGSYFDPAAPLPPSGGCRD